MTLEKYLEKIENGEQPVKHTGLVQLSGLSQQELFLFNQAWAKFPLERKTHVLSKLIEMAEENPELDFNAVFWTSLKDGSEEVREKAVEGLWECDDRALIIPLISLLRRDPSEKVRAAAALALGKFTTLAEEKKLLSRDGNRIIQALFEVLRNPAESTEVRRRVIETISGVHLPEIKAEIEQAYLSQEPGMKYSAIYAMGRSSDISWLPRILEEMDSHDSAMRYASAVACGMLGDEAAVPYLINLLEDDDTKVQLAAVEALGQIGGPLAKRALQRCLKLGEQALEEAAQEALAALTLNEDPLSFRAES
ncbi:MAG: HEAT repeat domain-containing protein [Chloroflexi bacterium]|nr:HEAT repeat domain-containing protein [Chloroflexota bacterium]